MSPWSQIRLRPEAERQRPDFLLLKTISDARTTFYGSAETEFHRARPPISSSGLLKLKPVLAAILAYANTHIDPAHSCEPFQACPSLHLSRSRGLQNKTFTYTLSGELIR